MLDIEIGAKRDCEGFTRRDVLRIGGLTRVWPDPAQSATGANRQSTGENRQS